MRVAWGSNDVDFDFIFVCIASLHIARFRAGVASSKVTTDLLSAASLGHFASIRDCHRMVAFVRPRLWRLLEKKRFAAETNEPVGLEDLATLGD